MRYDRQWSPLSGSPNIARFCCGFVICDNGFLGGNDASVGFVMVAATTLPGSGAFSGKAQKRWRLREGLDETLLGVISEP